MVPSIEEIEESLARARSEIAEIMRNHSKEIVDGQSEMQKLLLDVEKFPFHSVEVMCSHCNELNPRS
jgi:hypothetical protein